MGVMGSSTEGNRRGMGRCIQVQELFTRQVSEGHLFETERMFCDAIASSLAKNKHRINIREPTRFTMCLREGPVQVGAERQELMPGMAAHASSGEEHAVEKAGNRSLVMLVSMAPHP